MKLSCLLFHTPILSRKQTIQKFRFKIRDLILVKSCFVFAVLFGSLAESARGLLSKANWELRRTDSQSLRHSNVNRDGIVSALPRSLSAKNGTTNRERRAILRLSSQLSVFKREKLNASNKRQWGRLKEIELQHWYGTPLKLGFDTRNRAQKALTSTKSIIERSLSIAGWATF